MIRYLLFFIFLCLSVASSAANITEQRKLFIKTMDELKRGNETYFLSVEKHLKSYILYPFLRQAYISRHLIKMDQSEIDHFLKTYPDSQTAQQVYYQWLHVLAQREQWQALIGLYQSPAYPTDRENVTLQCLYRTALLETGNPSAALENIKPLWLVSKTHPKACEPVFQAWKQTGGLTLALILERIQLAALAGNPGLTTQLINLLPKNQQPSSALWQRVYAIQQQAKKDPDAALATFKTLKSQFNAQQQGAAIRGLALGFATNGDPRAITWLAQVPASATDLTVQEWRIRMALAHNQWDKVQQFIQALPEKEKQEPVWRYWLARALQATNQSWKANSLYESLANKPDYYGFLANAQLKRPFAYRPPAEKITASDIAAMAKRTGLQRAQELKQINWLSAARREWDFAIRPLNNIQLRAAGQLALKWGWPDRSIVTASKLKNIDDIALRLPIAYRHSVLAEAKAQNIDPSWVFAIMRQESAFMPDVKSHAGAMGLMQVMPATARWLATKTKEPIRTPNEVLQISKNIRLGTQYLQSVLDTYQGNLILATAAYNAGPGRAKKWLALRPALMIDQWIEMIPFNETRKYVKNVLAYTSIYDLHLGLTPNLDVYLQRIS